MVLRLASLADLDAQVRAPAAVVSDRPAKASKRPRDTSAEDLFAFQCRALKLPAFQREYRFATGILKTGKDGKKRPCQWRVDFAFLEYQVAVEIEGLVVRRIAGELVVTGRHSTISGFIEDCRKYATAAVLGLTVLRFPPRMLKDGEAIELTQRVLAARGWKRQ